MRAINEVERQHICTLLARADTEALLSATRQASLPDADAWSERLLAVQSAYEVGRIDFDTWLREHNRVYSAILRQMNASSRDGVLLPPLADIETLILQKHVEEALQRCSNTADEPLLLCAQYALGRREFEGGHLPLAVWEMLQQRLGYALVVFLEQHSRRKKAGCLNSIFRRR